MSAKRLSQEDRDDIYGHLALRAFGERREQVEDAKDAVGDLVYANLYPAATLKKMKALPPGWLPLDNDVLVKISGTVQRIYFRHKIGKKREYDKRIMSSAHISGCAEIYDGGHPVAEAQEHFLKLKTELENDESAARAEAMATLNRASNLKRLLEMWPDIEPITRKIFSEETGNTLPVVAVDKLNERFKLPEPKKSRSKA